MAGLDLAQALSMGADAIYLSQRPPPTAPTGYYDWQITVDTTDDHEGHSTIAGVVNRIEDFNGKGGSKPDPSHVVSSNELLSPYNASLNTSSQAAFLDTLQNPKAIDDRKGAVCAIF